MWLALASFGLYWATGLYNALREQFGAKEKEKRADFELQLPRAEEGPVVPLIYGRVRIRTPNVVWMGGASEQIILDEDGHVITPGFRYFVSMQLVLGIGNHSTPTGVNGGTHTDITKIWWGERLVFHGSTIAQGNAAIINESLGGPGNGGKIIGTMRVLPGSYTQEQPSDFVDKYESLGGDPDRLPDYRGFVVASFVDFCVGESPDLAPLSFEVQTTYEIGSGIRAFSTTGGGDFNAAVVLWSLLTNPWTRLGYAESELDEDTFVAAATVLAGEPYGVSLYLEDPDEAQGVFDAVLRQIDGVFRQNSATGKWELKLVREDYDVGDLDTLDPSNVLSVIQYAPRSPEETINHVTVTFNSRQHGYISRTTTPVQSMGSINAVGRRPRVIDFPYCTLPQWARRLAARELRALSLPLATARVEVSRSMWSLRQGDVVKLTWPEYDLDEVVMRVMGYDLGELLDGRVVLELAQDRFAFDRVVFDDFPWEVLPFPTPFVSTERVAEEAPRWLQQRAYAAGAINDPDVQRAWYLAVPRRHATTVAGKISPDGVAAVLDTPSRAFPMIGRLVTALGRVDEVDTPATVVFDFVTDHTVDDLTAGAWSGVSVHGRNLFRIDDEIMAFLGASSGPTRVTGVERGLFDTVPAPHAVGAPIYFISTDAGIDIGRLGATGLDDGAAATAKVCPRAFMVTEPMEAYLLDPFTVDANGGRVARPYPVSALTLDGVKEPDALEEEGVDVAWVTRDELAVTIARPSDASEDVDAGIEFDVLARPLDPGLVPAMSTLFVEIEADLPYDTDENLDSHLGRAGYGPIEMFLRAHTGAVLNWQDAALTIEAPCWRNLLLNPRFAANLDHWTATSGTLERGTSGALGSAGAYAMANVTSSSDLDVSQLVWISGYVPGHMRLVLDFRNKLRTDAQAGDDELTVEIVTYDSLGTVLDTETFGPQPPGPGWFPNEVVMDDLDEDAAFVRVRFLGERTGELDVTPDTLVTELALRLGQITDQLLLNPNFETGITSWDEAVGTFGTDSSFPYTGVSYAKADDVATAELAQTVATPDGWQYGLAVFEVAVGSDTNGNSDTAEVVVEALDGSANVIATATSGASTTPTVQGEWERRRVVLDYTDGATEPAVEIRVRLIGVRVGTMNICFDEANLRLHKQLALTESWGYQLDHPVAQQLPRSLDEWNQAWPTTQAYEPIRGIWAGNKQGQLGIEPTMESTDDGVEAGQLFVGAWDGWRETYVTDALGFGVGGSGYLKATDPDFAAFRSDDPFTILAFFKDAEEVATAERDLVTRLGTTGFALGRAATGYAYAELVGADGTATATATATKADGRTVRAAALVYDPVAEELRLVTDAGEEIIESTAAIGEIACDENGVKFSIGSNWLGQIARTYVIPAAVPTAVLGSILTHGGDPTGAGLDEQRTGTGAAVVASGADAFAASGLSGSPPSFSSTPPVTSVLVSRFGADQVATGWMENFYGSHDASNGMGLPVTEDRTNLAPANLATDATLWDDSAGVTVTVNALAGPEGMADAFLLVGDNGATAYREFEVNLSAAADQQLVFFAQAQGTTHDAIVKLFNSTPVEKESVVYEASANAWIQISIPFSAWDDSTATALIRFYASDTGTPQGVYIAGPYYVGPTMSRPALIPNGGAALTMAPIVPETFPDMLNHEGELLVVCCATEASPGREQAVASLQNASTWAKVAITEDDEPIAIAADTVSSTGVVDVAWNQIHTLRARWNRAGLLDASAVFSGLVAGNSLAADKNYGGVTTWAAETDPFTQVCIGADGETAPFNGLIRLVQVRTREGRLPLIGGSHPLDVDGYDE